MQTTKELNEIEFHKKVAARSRSSLIPFGSAVIERYQRLDNWKIFEKELIFKCIKDYSDRMPKPLVVADFGCGDGANSCQIAKINEDAFAVGFDLSPDLIEVARERAKLNGVDDRTEFVVANAEEDDPLKGKKVDVMLCLNILHHVELDSVIPNLLNATKPKGMIVFQEPIAFSNTLQWLRDILPVEKDVTPDERQLSKEEIDYLLGIVDTTEVYYNWMLSRLTRFLPNRNKIDSGHPFTKACIQFLGWSDRLLIALLPFLKKFCGRVVIIGHKKE